MAGLSVAGVCSRGSTSLIGYAPCLKSSRMTGSSGQRPDPPGPLRRKARATPSKSLSAALPRAKGLGTTSKRGLVHWRYPWAQSTDRPPTKHATWKGGLFLKSH